MDIEIHKKLDECLSYFLERIFTLRLLEKKEELSKSQVEMLKTMENFKGCN